ncbi:FAD-dependent monooxygenase [Mycolicibacterium sp. BiH015]|uniref:FAD-dependent monooxygenase n=1 Tax=Mycolicibacterium sp. BiH015 TaxID=3018808 RepID=UPI0022E85A2D|nr:FAD-dependent monooxygenase [Mycolicibacterium sp. BiH015]MDA2890463.1 FAD-dependent monooxygenase [Mycolicibacterium sp. BiH015]
MDILVSGAGIAGLACALELGSRGHVVTVVESAAQLRTSGTPIDIRGDAIGIADQMGVLRSIRERRIRMSEQTYFVDGAGRPIAAVPVAEMSDSDDDIELLRADLMNILADAVANSVSFRFGDSIQALSADGAAQLASGHHGRYDIVIGADGQHSTVRRMIFGPDEQYLKHLGVYFALAEHPGEGHAPGPNAIHNTPGRMAGLLRYGGKAVAAFQFLSEPIDYDYRDLDAQKQILVDAFAGHRSWRIPELLDVAVADPSFYLTAAAQIHLPCWHRGRVALVGDAGYCAAYLSGRGTSLALTGAHFLAEELAGGDFSGAFARYESRQRPYVAFAQHSVDRGRDRMLPATWDAIAERNRALRV